MTIAEITIKMNTGRLMATRVRPISEKAPSEFDVSVSAQRPNDGRVGPAARPAHGIASITANSSSISNYPPGVRRAAVPILSPFREHVRSGGDPVMYT